MKYNVGLTLAQFDELIKLIDDDENLNEELLLTIREHLDNTRTKLRDRLANPPTKKGNPRNRVKKLDK